MSVSRLACPACQAIILSSQPIPVGKTIKCPKCSQPVTVPGEAIPSQVPGNPAAGDAGATSSVSNQEAVRPAPPAADEPEMVPIELGLAPLDGEAAAKDQPTKTQGETSPVLVDDAAIIVEAICPSCGHQGNVPEMFLGKKVKCRKCNVLFTVTDSTKAPPSRPKTVPATPAASRQIRPAAAVSKAALAKRKQEEQEEEVVDEDADSDDSAEMRPAKRRRRQSEEDETKRPVGMILAGVGIGAVVIAGLVVGLLEIFRPEIKFGQQADPRTFQSVLPVRATMPVPPVPPPVKFQPKFDDWLQDLAQAKTQAAAEKKDILILFTGSDWNPLSILLANNVLFRPEFKQQATQQFVLVLIDFPRNQLALLKVQDAARNERLMRQFGIEGFPTVLLMDAKGMAYATATEGFQEGGPADYLQALGKLQELRVERDRLLTAIEQAAGIGKLAAAKEAYNFLHKYQLLQYYEPLLDVWSKLSLEYDPSNEHGYSEFFFPIAWLHRTPSNDFTRLLKVEQLEARMKAFRFKDVNLGAFLHLVAARFLAKAGRVADALRHTNEAIAYKPTDKELKEELSAARRALDGAEAAPADLRFEAGTGFVVASGGYVLTNAHVVEGKGKIMVRLAGVKEPVPADIVARDEERDMALIQIKSPEVKNLKPLLIAGNRPINRGEKVAALGYPGGSLLGGGLKFTQGAVSSIPERGSGQMLLLDLKVNPGNSGGPLCDSCGNVIGMVTAKTGASGTFESYGKALPGKDLEAFLQKNLKTFKAGVASRKALEWDQVDRLVSPSVLMILNTAP